jgi:LCP family protein required for cell wall assembly
VTPLTGPPGDHTGSLGVPDEVALDVSSRRRRTVAQRLVLVFNSVAAIACFATAGLVAYSYGKLGDRKLAIIERRPSVSVPSELTVPPTTDPFATDDTVVVPVGDVNASNFLLAGSDNRSCIDPDSPYAGAFLEEGQNIGERSDTIIVLRVDPDTNQAALLSFPRDLWVKIPGRSSKSKINSAFDRENPSKLIQTIEENFGIPVDHYINVDFCAFRDIVNAVGGVEVPFEYPARDRNTGLNVPEAGCFEFDGDHALAYVRSRKYQYFDPKRSDWFTDGTSDFGRITRQQDFFRRALQKALDRGARNPAVAKKIIDTALKYVVTDSELTVDTMLQLANAMRSFDPTTVRTYQIEGRNDFVGNNAVVLPNLRSESMQAVLAVFRGEARLADAPDQVVTPTTTTLPRVDTTVPSSTTAPGAPTTSVTLPEVEAEDTLKGIYPPRDVSCG